MVLKDNDTGKGNYVITNYTGRVGLAGVGPDVLEQTVLLGKSVEGVVGLASGSDVAAQGVGDVLAWDGSALLVDLGDVDLDRGVVVGLDDSVGGRALSWNV